MSKVIFFFFETVKAGVDFSFIVVQGFSKVYGWWWGWG
jgi:hypothetical protein